MAIPLEAIRAVKGKESAQALKNDLYVRKWTSVKGKGKSKKVVEHEAHLNPASVGVGAVGLAVGAGLAGLAAVLALRFGGRKLAEGDAELIRIVRIYSAKTEQVKVVDTPAIPAHYITVNIKGVLKTVWIPEAPEVSHMETRILGQRVVVLSKRGVPVRTFNMPDGAVVGTTWDMGLKPNERAQGWDLDTQLNTVTGSDKYGGYMQTAYKYTNPNKTGYSLEDKEDESWVSKIFGV